MKKSYQNEDKNLIGFNGAFVKFAHFYLIFCCKCILTLQSGLVSKCFTTCFLSEDEHFIVRKSEVFYLWYYPACAKV